MNYFGLAYLGATIGAALCVIGGAYGIGRIGSAALESDARQPAEEEKLRTLMILSIAFIEGLALFALVACLIVIVTLGSHLPK